MLNIDTPRMQGPEVHRRLRERPGPTASASRPPCCTFASCRNPCRTRSESSSRRLKRTAPPEDLEILGRMISGTWPVASDESCQLFELVWTSYVTNSVRNESFGSCDDAEDWEGKLFRIYRKSHLRDVVSRGTFATDAYSGPLRHRRWLCLNRLVDVVAFAEPKVRRLRPD